MRLQFTEDSEEFTASVCSLCRMYFLQKVANFYQITLCHIKNTFHKHRCKNLDTSCRPAQPIILLSKNVLSAWNNFEAEIWLSSVKGNFISLVTGRSILEAQKLGFSGEIHRFWIWVKLIRIIQKMLRYTYVQNIHSSWFITPTNNFHSEN
jgi:hypothetical protein